MDIHIAIILFIIVRCTEGLMNWLILAKIWSNAATVYFGQYSGTFQLTQQQMAAVGWRVADANQKWKAQHSFINEQWTLKWVPTPYVVSMWGAPLIGKDKTKTKHLRSVEGQEEVVSAVSNESIVHGGVWRCFDEEGLFKWWAPICWPTSCRCDQIE